MKNSGSLINLTRVLGYCFNNEELLKQALSHKSVGRINNERLEFLGDSILNFTIAQELYSRYPSANEGELSRMRASLVKGDTLVQVALHFSLGDYLVLGIGERKSGGFRRSSILEDAIEAIIGAIYLDSDLKTCQQSLLRWYQEILPDIFENSLAKDSKSKLQEWLQANKYPLPLYELVEVTGQDHNQTFYIKCILENLQKSTQGQAKTRRIAEQIAATKALEVLNVE